MRISTIQLTVLIIFFGVRVTAAQHIRIGPGTPIVVNDRAPAPLQRAVRDLQRDLEKILGSAPPIVHDLDEAGEGTALVVAGPVAGWQGLDRSAGMKGTEAHAVYVAGDKRPYPYIVMQGSDMRGTIYAIYTFSEKVLQIPPLWYYCGWKPVRKQTIPVPADLDIRFDAPEVKYRAWFPNDMDLLEPWRRLSAENNEIWLETALRLKLNTIEWLDAGERVFNEKYTVSPTAALIHQYGLINTTHHHNPLNASFENWDNYWKRIRKMEPPGLLLANEEKLVEYWRYNIEAIHRSGLEMIWVIGFRGAGDHPFWYTFKDAPRSMKKRGAVISRMLKKQRELVMEITGNPDAQFRTIFYDELSDLLAAGYLHPPEDPDLIWNFAAARRDHYPNKDIQKLEPGKDIRLGYYFNYQFTSTGSHLAAAEGPWKMERNYRYVSRKSSDPILFSVVNAGNIREHVMELSANAAMMWDTGAYTTDRFLKKFCMQYFGSDLADSIALLYRKYYEAYWNQKRSYLEGFDRQYIFQDLRYRRAITQLAGLMGKPYDPDPLADLPNEQLPGRTFRIVPPDNGAASQVEAIIRGTSRSDELFFRVKASAERLEQQLTGYHKTFFHDNLSARASFMYYLNKTLVNMAKAYRLEPGFKRTNLIREAGDAMKKAHRALQTTEHGPFQSWYDPSRIFNVKQLIQTLDNIFLKERQPD